MLIILVELPLIPIRKSNFINRHVRTVVNFGDAEPRCYVVSAVSAESVTAAQMENY